jgi:hypothetical protein
MPDPTASPSLTSPINEPEPTVAASIGPDPANPTPIAAIDAFIARFRPGTASFHLDIEGGYDIGTHRIDYDLTGVEDGRDIVVEGIQVTDGTKVELGYAFVDGRPIAKAGTGGWTSATTDAGQAAVFAASLYRFDRAIVLEDLGATGGPGLAQFRLRIAAAMSLYPPQFVNGFIKDQRNPTEEITVDITEDGIPQRATYTKSVEGTVDGAATTASGEIEFRFSEVGGPGSIALPTISPDPSAPVVPRSSAGPLIEWARYQPEGGSFAARMPGAPIVTTADRTSPGIGTFTVRTARFGPAAGPRYSVIDSVLPTAFVAARSADELRRLAGRSTAEGVAATVVGERDVNYNGIEGREFIAANETGVYRYREFLIGNTLVELGVVGPPEQLGTVEVDEFLASLKVAP